MTTIRPEEPVRVTIIVESDTVKQTTVFTDATKPYMEVLVPEFFMDDIGKIRLTFKVLPNDEGIFYTTKDELLTEVVEYKVLEEGPNDG